jgi:hypothetical protein
MTISSLLLPAFGPVGPELRTGLVEVAPTAVAIAVALVLLTAGAVVALVVEVRRDGYGLERPRPLSREFPWQLEVPGRRRGPRRARDSWALPRASRAAHR